MTFLKIVLPCQSRVGHSLTKRQESGPKAGVGKIIVNILKTWYKIITLQRSGCRVPFWANTF